jgi:hypothetical protein
MTEVVTLVLLATVMFLFATTCLLTAGAAALSSCHAVFSKGSPFSMWLTRDLHPTSLSVVLMMGETCVIIDNSSLSCTGNGVVLCAWSLSVQ